MSIQVQTEFYTDENSHQIRLLALRHPSGFHVIASEVPEQIDIKELVYEFEMVYFEDDWHKQSPPLFVFDGRCVWYEDKKINHGWWTFKGAIIPATVPEWGEISHG